jgi:hypothetical protein
MWATANKLLLTVRLHTCRGLEEAVLQQGGVIEHLQQRLAELVRRSSAPTPPRKENSPPPLQVTNSRLKASLSLNRAHCLSAFDSQCHVRRPF